MAVRADAHDLALRQHCEAFDDVGRVVRDPLMAKDERIRRVMWPECGRRVGHRLDVIERGRPKGQLGSQIGHPRTRLTERHLFHARRRGDYVRLMTSRSIARTASRTVPWSGISACRSANSSWRSTEYRLFIALIASPMSTLGGRGIVSIASPAAHRYAKST